MKKGLFVGFWLTLVFITGLSAESKVVFEWDFDADDAAAGWTCGGATPLSVADGAVSALYTGIDPYLISPAIDHTPRPGQYVEIRMKTVSRGGGEVFFAPSNEGPHGGFSQENATAWKLINDGQWHTYTVFPDWNRLPKVVKIRLDFGAPDPARFNQDGFSVDSIKIVDMGLDALPAAHPDWTFNAETTGWNVVGGAAEKSADGWRLLGDTSAGASGDLPPDGWNQQSGGGPKLVSDLFALKIGSDRYWLSITAKNLGLGATLSFIGSKTRGEFLIPIDLDAAGDDFVTYNIPLLSTKEWGDTVYRLKFGFGETLLPPTIRKIEVRTTPTGKARIRIGDLGLTDALNRCGAPLPLGVELKNIGGQPAENLTLAFDHLPDGVTVAAEPNSASQSRFVFGSLEAFDTISKTLYLNAARPVTCSIFYTILADGLPAQQGEFTVDIAESLNLPKADYVPEPVAAELLDPELEIGALYFPGWASRGAWERIRPVAPIRKPVLGWYDEGNPEVVDWQIKWAREAGISFFLVDWYWSRGRISLDHWVRAFQKARYRDQFKWAMMWANHNGPGSHSVEDQTAVTKYWIENYFNTPEYYTIDGKPVVMIWSAEGMDSDMRKIEREKNGRELEKGEGVKILLDTSRKIAVEAGLAGIYFVAMKWPEASTRAEDIQWLEKAGFDMTSIYHYMNPGRAVENPRRFDFDDIVASSLPWWRARHETGILPFLPNLSTGWDDRPWNNHLVIANRTPEKFRKVCEDMKTFLAESNVKRICLAPLNEWGEGSYAEPNREYGFKMYEALRETFCKKPEAGWPVYYGPADVGLGPYDYPVETLAVETSWTFGEKTSWRPLMGLEKFALSDGVMKAVSVHADPAFMTPLGKIAAKDFSRFKFRMKLTAKEGAPSQSAAQLFWGTLVTPVCEAQSQVIPVQIDGEFHDYEIHLADSNHWTGRITSFRLDPVNKTDITVEIESIALE